MYTFPFARQTLAVFLLAITPAFAQNLDLNSTFDEGLEDWTTSGFAQWLPTFGVEGGSLHLSSEKSTAAATQCIIGGSGSTYVAAADVYSHCVGARVLYVLWATAEDCSDTEAFTHSFYATSTVTGQWEHLTVLAPAPTDAHFVEIRLFASDGCVNDLYFDNVTLQNDRIDSDGFEGILTE